MIINHGTDRRYSDGCRCDECREAHKLKAREYRDRKRRRLTRPALRTAVMSMESSGPGPVELAVETELAGLAAAQERPGLAATAVALAKLMDGPAVTSKLAAAQRLLEILNTLGKGSSVRRRKLAVVKPMTKKGGACWPIFMRLSTEPPRPFTVTADRFDRNRQLLRHAAR